MDENWTKKEAAKAAKEKCEQAGRLLEEARSIFHEIDYDVASLNISEALTYIEEVIS